MAMKNTATIEPLTDQDIQAAVEGHNTTVEDVSAAVAKVNAVLSEFANEYADSQIPDGHGEYSDPTVIWESDDYVCFYVTHGMLYEEAEDHPDIQEGDDTAKAVAWAHNAFARRHGAAADALGTMDAVVLPRTETVDEIIADRE